MPHLTRLTDYPIIFGLLSFLLLWLAAWIGVTFLRRHRELDEGVREDFGVVLAATLTLLGLILGFSFSMAISRYDQRKNLEEEEANAIGTQYLRAGLLPAADAAKVRALLKDYLDLRIQFYIVRDEEQYRQINARTAKLQTELWNAVQAPAVAQPIADHGARRGRHERRAQFPGLHAGRVVEPDSPYCVDIDDVHSDRQQSAGRLRRAVGEAGPQAAAGPAAGRGHHVHADRRHRQSTRRSHPRGAAKSAQPRGQPARALIDSARPQRKFAAIYIESPTDQLTPFPPRRRITMIPLTRCLPFAAMAACAIALAAPAAAQTKEPLKIGFVYVSPIGDAGWTFQHDTGRKEMEKALGGKVTTKYIESVPEGADAERVIRDLAQSGHNLIFTTSFGYMNPTLKVATAFPKVDFEHATGYKTAKNVGIYNARFYEGRYLAGIVAGKMSKTGVAGYVAAFPIPEVVMGINAFARGMRSVNPKAEVKVIWTNSWFDPGRESEASTTLVSQGADVLTHHTDSTATVQTAEAKKVYAIAYHSDMSKYGPNAQLTAVTHHWGDYYTKVAQSVVDGKWQQDNVWGGIKDGMIKLAPFNKVVPPDVVAMVKKAEGEIAAGKLHPFTGPMKTNDGKEVLAAGKTITDAELSKMDYYVEGVVGKLPASK